ncbi:SLATT domain-containing protein, partial [Streptomyces phaeochromogenes]|uniref:SLATT domain-containing protein n=1 Tax=Streptomyces phaeochromogenes TaxID=1923 RepID=UPI0012FF24AE
MQPEGSAQDGNGRGDGARAGGPRPGPGGFRPGGPGRSGPRRGVPGRGALGSGGPRHSDLMGRTFPLGDWGEPAERLHELYRWVEAGALTTASWYLAERVWKRRGARAGAYTHL